MKFPTPSQIAECGGPCETQGPDACDCGLRDYDPEAAATRERLVTFYFGALGQAAFAAVARGARLDTRQAVAQAIAAALEDVTNRVLPEENPRSPGPTGAYHAHIRSRFLAHVAALRS